MKDGSCTLYPMEKKGLRGTVTIDGLQWYVTIISTGRERPSNEVFLRNKEGTCLHTVLFKNGPDKKSMLGGKIVLHKTFGIDIYRNQGEDGSTYYRLSVWEMTRQTTEPQQQAQQPVQGNLIEDAI